MRILGSIITLAVVAVSSIGAPANAGDLFHDIGRILQKTAPAGKAIEKGAHDAGNAIEKGVHDTGKAIEKGAHDTGNAIEKGAQDIEIVRSEDYKPPK